MKLKRIIVNLPEEMINKLNEAVEQQETYESRSGLIRRIINAHFKKKKEVEVNE